MSKIIRAAVVAVAAVATAAPALADETLDSLISQIQGPVVNAPVVEESVIVRVPDTFGTAAYEEPTVDAAGAPRPDSSQPLDMTGADGTLRGCYAHGGMARQAQDLQYYCNYETASASGSGSSHILPPDAETGYAGHTDVEDEALVDCVSRGGTLIQLAGNQNFACAM